jgi:hypothetical protein
VPAGAAGGGGEGPAGAAGAAVGVGAVPAGAAAAVDGVGRLPAGATGALTLPGVLEPTTFSVWSAAAMRETHPMRIAPRNVTRISADLGTCTATSSHSPSARLTVPGRIRANNARMCNLYVRQTLGNEDVVALVSAPTWNNHRLGRADDTALALVQQFVEVEEADGFVIGRGSLEPLRLPPTIVDDAAEGFSGHRPIGCVMRPAPDNDGRMMWPS